MQLHSRVWGDATLEKTAVLVHGLAGRRSNVSPADAQAFVAKLGSGAVITIPGASPTWSAHARR